MSSEFHRLYYSTASDRQYCGESLPKYPSPDLVTVRRRLEALGRGAKDWSKTSEHCGLHRAETSIIPLGWREKYPREIDFAKLDTRLEAGFVHTRLRHIVTKPDDSKFFRRAERCICIKGVRAWQTAAVQQEALSFATPG